jgi:hypothetical protein
MDTILDEREFEFAEKGEEELEAEDNDNTSTVEDC